MKNKSKLGIIKIEKNTSVLEVPGNEMKPVLEISGKLPSVHKEAIKSNIGNTSQNTKLNRRRKQLSSSTAMNNARGSKRETIQPMINQNSEANILTLPSATSAMTNQNTIVREVGIKNSQRKMRIPMTINNPQSSSSVLLKNQNVAEEKNEATKLIKVPEILFNHNSVENE